MSRGETVAGGARRAPWALMYHAVGDPADDPYQVTVSPRRLARQLRWLSRRGLTGVSMRELLAARAAGRADHLVGLTFDDGYADFVTHAVPLLCEAGHTATVFVLPGRLGGVNAWDPLGPRRPLLDADGIRAARAAGMEVGSHGLLHRDLTAADDAVLDAEIAASRRLLTEITGSAPLGFCYPYGALDDRAVRAVRRAGYTYACAVGPTPLAGAYALPRAYIGERDAALRLHAKRAVHRLRCARLPEPLPDPDAGHDPATGGRAPGVGRTTTARPGVRTAYGTAATRTDLAVHGPPSVPAPGASEGNGGSHAVVRSPSAVPSAPTAYGAGTAAGLAPTAARPSPPDLGTADAGRTRAEPPALPREDS